MQWDHGVSATPKTFLLRRVSGSYGRVPPGDTYNVVVSPDKDHSAAKARPGLIGVLDKLSEQTRHLGEGQLRLWQRAVHRRVGGAHTALLDQDAPNSWGEEAAYSSIRA